MTMSNNSPVMIGCPNELEEDRGTTKEIDSFATGDWIQSRLRWVIDGDLRVSTGEEELDCLWMGEEWT